MYKRVSKIILITLIQVFALFFVHNILYLLYPIQHKEVGFRILIYHTGIIFIVLLFVYNFCVEFYNKYIYLIAIFFIITSCVLPISVMNFRPFRSLFLIILVIFGFISSIVIFKWRNKNNLEPKSEFHKKIKNYFEGLSENKIPTKLLSELIINITNTEYDNYKRFWDQYPKSRNRYSKLSLEDLEHPFINYQIIDFFKQNSYENYEKYSMILLKMNGKEFEEYLINKHQYETK